MDGEARRKSPWAWIGGGCLVVLAIALSVAVIGGFYAWRWAADVKREQSDPRTRQSRAEQILGTTSIPEGYHVLTALSLPLVGEVVVLSDQPASPDGKGKAFRERGLIYLRSSWIARKDAGQELEDYFAGRTEDPEVLRRNRINVKAETVLRRGVVEGPPRILYLVQRGEVDFQNEARHRGLMTIAFIDCPQDEEKKRLAIWFGPDPAQGGAIEDAMLAGTNGDENEIRTFFGRFAMCP